MNPFGKFFNFPISLIIYVFVIIRLPQILLAAATSTAIEVEARCSIVALCCI